MDIRRWRKEHSGREETKGKEGRRNGEKEFKGREKMNEEK